MAAKKVHSESSAAPTGTSPWMSAILLGPLVPTILALVTVVLGQFTFLADPVCSSKDGSGSSNTGCQFLSGAVAASYLEIIVFSWVFMGTTVTVTLPGGKSYRVLRPFSSLNVIVGLYGVIYLISLGVFGYGATFLADTAAQKESSAMLVNFSLILQAAYWFMSIIMAVALIMIKMKTRKGGKRGEYKAEKTVRMKEKALEHGSEAWFKDKFEIQSDGMEMMESTSMDKFFISVDMDVPEEDIERIVDQLDVEDTGDIQFGAVWRWYQDEGKRKFGKVLP
eukprot:CAMPEP_0118647682 /NCGR_PEP_ID=MMETSP0785-20121206/8742_1 /TAXON_ID=91992 /ORGANISM="Bolidomonas pacifica, Strain CCMP 1866" /LENGTH=279 /DNA_ID=CAMNT_0006539803 /DNA_START=106 /DNA_END=942 /DNA_ORIENTATION=-